MDISCTKKDNSLFLHIFGELDECSSKSAKEILDNIINNNLNYHTVVFDLSGLSFMDSTGVGLLIGRYKKLKSFSIESFITGANMSTEKVIELSGLYSIMPKY